MVEHAVIHRHSKNFCPGPTFPFGGFTLVMCILSGHFIQEIRAQTYQSCQKCGFQLIKLKHEDLGCAGNLWDVNRERPRTRRGCDVLFTLMLLDCWPNWRLPPYAQSLRACSLVSLFVQGSCEAIPDNSMLRYTGLFVILDML